MPVEKSQPTTRLPLNVSAMRLVNIPVPQPMSRTRACAPRRSASTTAFCTGR